VTLRTLRDVFVELATPGRHRSSVMRSILDERLLGLEPGESEQEKKIARWIVAAGLPRPVHQHRVTIDGRRYRLDLAYPSLRIDIEYDGWDAHRTRSTFERDRQRDMDLEEHGWRVLRFTARSGRDDVVVRVTRAINLRSK
jgi:very-short-patch-repair endonuclease